MTSRKGKFWERGRPASLAVLLLAVFICASHARAQSATATLTGTVVDETGAVVPGVEMTLLNLSTALERHAATNHEGVYTVPLLPPGRYTLTAQRDGFTTVEVRGLVLNVNDQLALRVRLRVGELGETITVVADLDRSVSGVREAPAVSTVVSRNFVENLPLNGRSFRTLLELAPGTTLTRASFNEQGQFSAGGQRANSNYFTVDGVSANVGVSAGAAPGQAASGTLPALTVLGGTSNLVSLDALEEFRIQTSSYAPEFGRTTGAHVSIVTRSGTNELHGTLYDFFRDDALDANDWFANSRGLRRPALRQHDFGGTLGGPIRRDRVFFFASYEGLRLEQPQVAITDVPSASARRTAPAPLRPFLEAFPVPTGPDLANGLAEFAASYSDRSRFDAASLRLDHIASDALTLFARFNIAPSETIQRGGVSAPGLSGQSLNTVGRTRLDTQTLTAGASYAPASSALNDLRFNWSRAAGRTTLSLDDFGGAAVPSSSLLFPPASAPGEAGFQFILRGGINSSLGVGRSVNNLQRQINLVDNLSVVSGAHHFKLGADFRRLTPTYGPLRYMQSVVFGDGTPAGILSALTAARAFQVRVVADAETREPVFTNLSVYAQDTFRATPRLTVTYGLRWELNPPPRERGGRDPFALAGLDSIREGIVIGGNLASNPNLALAPRGTPLWQASYTNFAPRVGLAYQLSPERGTVLRAGLGIFHDMGTGQAAQAFGSVFPYAKEKVLTDVTFPLDPVEAAPPPIDTEPPYGTIYAFVPDLKLPRVLQWNATVEHPLGANQTVSASYVGAQGRRLLRQAALLRPNEQFTLVRVTTNNSSSDYDALQFQFARRLAGGLQALATYTYAHSRDDDSDDSSNYLFTASRDPDSERGPSNFDVRHSATAAVTYNLPPFFERGAARALTRGWAVDAVLRARTAAPVNIVERTGQVFGDLQEARRPDLVAGVPVYLDDPAAPGGRRLNRAAFASVVGRQGNLGRNAIRGFGFSQVDLALRREFRLTERARLQLRAEVFNLLNRPSFGDPVGDLASPHFGESTQTLARSLGVGGANGGLSPLYQVGGPRTAQLALKLIF